MDVSVLVTHDGSPLSGVVVEAVSPLLTPRTSVTLLHVQEAGDPDDVEIAKAEAHLLQRCGAVTRRNVVSRDPAAAILDVVAERRPDLVAMTTHGRSGLERLVRGSVAERVLRRSPSPVFMINPLAQQTFEIDSILVPLDSSANAAQVVDSVIPWARELDAKVTLLFVDWDDPTDTRATRAKRRAARARDVERWFAGPRARVEAAGLEVDVRIEHGDVVEEIVRLADPQHFGLLAISTHGRSGPGRWFLGSIAEKVLRECRIPVFLHRTE